MTNVLFLYLCLCSSWLQCDCVFSPSQCNLQVTNLHNERELKCLEYQKGCKTDENVQIVPDNLHKSVEKPATLFASSYLKDDSDEWFDAYLNITWTPPKSATALKNLKGFLLRFSTFYPKPHKYCRTFLIEDGLTPHDWKAEFNHNVGPVYDASTYSIWIWSLPRSGENYEMAQTISVSTPSAENHDSLSSSAWTTYILYKVVKDNEVKVTFGFGSFNIEEFRVYLIEEHQVDTGAYSYFKTVFKSRSIDPKRGTVSFKDVDAGTYVLQVTPIDSLRFVENRCLCFTMEDGHRECSECMSSETIPFKVPGKVNNVKATKAKTITTSGNNLKPTEAKTTTTPGSVEGREPSESLTPKSNSKNGEEMLIIFLIFIVCLIVFGISSVLVLKSRSKSANQTTPMTAITMDPVPQDPAGNRKSILVLSAEDHYRHLEVVKDLVNILNQYCGLNVIYPPEHINEICRVHWKHWITRCLNKVDFVLIVTSESAAKLVQASLKRETYTFQQLTETGHLFMPMMRQVLQASSQEQTLDRYITVSFSYTSREYTRIAGFPTPHNFTLVNELQEFLCFMKNLSCSSTTATASDENSFINLQYSVLRAGQYESCNVHWFSERFVDERMNRLDSGYLSLAPHRLNNMSESSSPENQLENEDETDELGFYPPEEEVERVVFYNIPPEVPSSDCISSSVSTQLRQINDNYENSAY